ncbi:MAG: hypothetical protein V1849_03330 [Chloroflexota bacterium]
MKFLKGLGLSVLGTLLFLSLSLFGFAYTMNATLLDSQFMIKELDRLDIKALVREIYTQQIPPQQQFLATAIDSSIGELEPWMREQLRTVALSSYDYFLGKKPDLQISVNLQPAKDTLKNTLKREILKAPPPELAAVLGSLPPAQVDQYFEQYYQQFMQQMGIPNQWEVNLSQLPPDARQTFSDIRQYLGLYQTLYPVLIAVMVLSALGIILLHRQVRASTRSLGSIFLTVGIFGYADILLMKYLIGGQLPSIGLPVRALTDWLSRFFNDFLAPWEKFSIAVGVLGLVLLIVSFVYPKREAASEPVVSPPLEKGD